MARFFIDRPVFAWVIVIIVMLTGTLAVTTLPIAQYPDIAPPAISITANYPGASAKALEDTVTQVIEQKMKGLDRLAYISSVSESSGLVTITLTFQNGTDPDTAQVQVQNKLSLATASLPEEVQRQGLTVAKAVRNFVSVLAFISKDGSMSAADLNDYVAANVQEALSRIEGVGDTQLFGSQYSMRVWLNPSKLNSYRLTALDVRNALQAQNAQVSAGQLGGLPAVAGQQLNATITAQTRLRTAEQFQDILLRTQTDGSQVRLRDVARIELGSEAYDSQGRYNGKPTAGLALKLATGANALDTIAAIDAEIEQLRPFFPPGMEVVKPYDSTPFVRISIQEVVKTLVEAIVLVFLVMYLFLQNFRATLIPTIAVPVVLLGTFGVIAAFGFNINTLTMLSTGVIYRQFSITIVAAMTLSVLVAMVLTPALCASLLKPVGPSHTRATTGFFGAFNRWLDRGTARYEGGVRNMLGRRRRYMIAYTVLVGFVALAFTRIPTGFLPDEDQGTVYAIIQLPPGATQERTLEVIKQVERHLLEDQKEAVESVLTVAGFSFAGGGQNAGMAFIKLRPWDERNRDDLQINAIIAKASQYFATIQDASVFAFSPPAVAELGNASGFDLMLQDRANLGHDALMQARNQLLGALSQEPALVGVRPNGQEDTPELRLAIDIHKAGSMGLSLADINDTFSSAWGSVYVNDFIDRGRVKKVFMQADAHYRMLSEDIDRWYVRNATGDMVPFSAFASTEWTSGSPRLERYDGVPSVEILGMALPGAASSGEAMDIVERHAQQLPPGIGFKWTGISLQEREAGSQTLLLYTLSIAVVFLCLAALYESWAIPLAVILVVPLGVLGAVITALLMWKMNDVYFQVGLLTTIGLASKNAILIVEFAKDLYTRGTDLTTAAVTAARMRLRPILMTSLAFILGALPLMLSTGAGAGARSALGAAVIGGMVSGTVLAIFFVPLLFVVVMKLFARQPASQTDASLALASPAETLK